MKFNQKTENINYIKISYKDNDGFTHYIKAAVRFMSEYELVASAKLEENDISIDAPKEIELGIACDNGLYKANTILKKIEKENPYILFSIRTPDDMEFQQKREFFRVKLTENANIVYQIGEDEHRLSAMTYDISGNGVRIQLEEPIEFPEDVRLFLSLPDRLIDTKAKYIRTDEEDKILKVSFNFVDLSPSDIDYISHICFQKQMEERRKNLS